MRLSLIHISGEAESGASTRTADSAKIIYTANLTLETRDYDTARAALDAALSDADGYMESSSEYTNTDSTRSVSLTLRASLFDGINNPGNEEINYYYPTSDLVTGPDIIFFWVARMIMAGYEYEGQMPFKNCLLYTSRCV